MTFISFIGQVSEFVKNYNMGICSDTINVMNVKSCMMVLLTEFYLLIPLSVILTIFQGHSNVEQFITEDFVFLSS